MLEIYSILTQLATTPQSHIRDIACLHWSYATICAAFCTISVANCQFIPTKNPRLVKPRHSHLFLLVSRRSPSCMPWFLRRLSSKRTSSPEAASRSPAESSSWSCPSIIIKNHNYKGVRHQDASSSAQCPRHGPFQRGEFRPLELFEHIILITLINAQISYELNASPCYQSKEECPSGRWRAVPWIRMYVCSLSRTERNSQAP